jgi:aldehyde oxidoreductase
MSCTVDGKISALEYDIGLDHGAYTELGESLIMRTARFAGFPYHIPKIAGLVRVATTNHAFGTAFRGYGSPQAYTMGEAIVDMLAEKAGIDPFEFRYINIARPGDLNANQCTYKNYPMEEIMDKMRPHYERAVAAKNAADGAARKRRGVGLAWGGYNVTGGIDEATVALSLNPDDTITHYNTWEDLGQGGDIGTLMVTLEALKPLGVTPDRIKMVQNDTKRCPNTGMAASSRSHFMTGNAVRKAANLLMDAMRKNDGEWRTYDEMVAEGIPVKYEAKYQTTEIENICSIDVNTGKGNPSADYTYAFFMAEVEVDTDTGKTNVLRFTCVDDVGVIGNIDAVNGQALGGISHSIGFALSEHYEDPTTDNNMFRCGVPYIEDIPDDIVVIHCENPREDGPFGSSGASEAFQSAGHMAVINAISDACGVRVFELPANPEKVKKALLKPGNGGEDIPQRYFLGSDLYDELEAIKANPL